MKPKTKAADAPPPQIVIQQAAAPHPSWWKQAITGDDNRTIDPSWLVVMYAVFFVLPLVILALIGVAMIDVFYNKHEASVGGLGGGIAAVIGAVAGFIVSCSVILKQDRAPQSPSTTTTTAVQQTTVSAP